MDKKTGGLLATITATLICGLPGLCLCLFGGVTAAGIMPYETDLNGVAESGVLPSGYGFAMLCLALVFILIPVGVAFFSFRNKPEDGNVDVSPIPNEPIPPTS